MNEEPEKTGGSRNDKGQFVKGQSGNPKGRPEGVGISITTRIKQELEKCPEGEDKKTYLELLVKRILKKSIVDGNEQMIKSVWAYVDGLPQQNVDMTSDGERIGLFDFTQDKKTKEDKDDNRTDDSDKKTNENDKKDPGGSGRNEGK